MRFLTCSVFLVALFGLTLVGCKSSEQVEAEKKVVQDELDKLQGKWKIASRAGDADPDGEEDKGDKGLVVTIDKDTLIWSYDGEVFSRRKMTLRPSKDPKEVDLVYVDDKGKEITEPKRTKVTSGKKKGKTKETKTSIKEQAIYKLEGDKLTICIAWSEKSRPTDFTVPPGSGRYSMTLEKVKTVPESLGDEKAKEAKEKADKEAKEKAETEKAGKS